MTNYFKDVRNAYRRYKKGNCTQEFREELAEKIEEVKYCLGYNGHDQSAILSYILGEEVEYDNLLLNRIVADIRYQGTEIIVPALKPPEWRVSLVGNIIGENEYGETHEIRQGTKHFSPGTKVYIAPIHWGDGYEKVYVIGKPRGRRNLIQKVMSRSKIVNFRAQKVYSPVVLKMMQKSEIGWWDNDEETLDYLNELAGALNDKTFKDGLCERTEKTNTALNILSKKYNVDKQKISKAGQNYPVVTVRAYENCIIAGFYGYVNEDASAYKEHYYQISAEEIAMKIEKQIEAYNNYIIKMGKFNYEEVRLTLWKIAGYDYAKIEKKDGTVLEGIPIVCMEGEE
ncbi:MAG: hypothetical protein PHS19_04610, partial [Eubacteriales bacterium]|nr:hypothetical protein [Eubacteriales bacterium]